MSDQGQDAFVQTDLHALTEALDTIFSANGTAPLTVLERLPNVYRSTSPSDVLTCQLQNGSRFMVHCKYEIDTGEDVFDHRRGVAYEADVYREVLSRAGLTVPKFYGSHKREDSGQTWLFVEHLEDPLRLSKAGLTGLLTAARWLGQFHRISETLISEPALSFLNVYDAPYYVAWARRTSEFATPQLQRYPWLAGLCDRIGESVADFLMRRPTVIHGEFYPQNVLVRGGVAYPVDWESAAIAAGEIDLAALTEGWDDEITGECEREYQHSRWPEGPPGDFELSLGAARTYWALRWLGHLPEWTADPVYMPCFEQIQAHVERLGLI